MVASDSAFPREAVNDFGSQPPQASQTGMLVLAAIAAAAWAAYNAWRVFAIGPDDVVDTMPTTVVSLLALVLSAVAFFRGATSGTPYYPLIVLGLTQAAVSSAVSLWMSVMSMQGLSTYEFYLALPIAHIAYGALSAIALLTAAVFAAVRRSSEAAIVRHREAAAVKRLRNNVRTYFTHAPWWPWLLAIVAIFLLSMVVSAGTQSIGAVTTATELAFLGSIYVLLSDDLRTVRLLDPAPFFITLRAADTTHDLAYWRYIQPQSDPSSFWGDYFFYLTAYYCALLVVVIVYALAYRFIIFPFSRRATDAAIDTLIEDHARPMAGHGLARLGIDRARLIAEPVVLRGLPDRETLNGAFVGYHVGRDDVLRYTPQRSTVMAFSDDQVHYYEGTVDLTTGRIISETVVEFFYQDISNVARVNGAESVPLSRALRLKDRFLALFSRRKANRCDRILNLTTGQTLQYEGRDLFQINLESGRALVVILKDTSFFDPAKKRLVSMLKNFGPSAALTVAQATSLASSELPQQENERLMRAVRLLIRDKKRSLLLQRI